MAERVGLDLTQLRTEVDASLRTVHFLDYLESSKWASAATPVVDAIGDQLAVSPTACRARPNEPSVIVVLSV